MGHKGAKPTNSWIANILTAGEGWHANHYAEVYNYKIGREWWQFDHSMVYMQNFPNQL